MLFHKLSPFKVLFLVTYVYLKVFCFLVAMPCINLYYSTIFVCLVFFCHARGNSVALVRVKMQVARVDYLQNSSSNEELNPIGFEEHNDIKFEEHVM